MEKKAEEIVLDGEVGEDLLDQFQSVNALVKELEDKKEELDNLAKTAKFEADKFYVLLKSRVPDCISKHYTLEERDGRLVVIFPDPSSEQMKILQMLMDLKNSLGGDK